MVNDNKGDKDEFNRFSGNFSLIGTRKFTGVMNPWPEKKPEEESGEKRTQNCQENPHGNEEDPKSQENNPGNSGKLDKLEENHDPYVSSMDIDLEILQNIQWTENVDNGQDQNGYVINGNVTNRNASNGDRKQGESSGSRNKTRWE